MAVFGVMRSEAAHDTEHRTPNTEHRTPNTEHRTPNTEHRTPNTDHRRRPPKTDRRPPIALDPAPRCRVDAGRHVIDRSHHPRTPHDPALRPVRSRRHRAVRDT